MGLFGAIIWSSARDVNAGLAPTEGEMPEDPRRTGFYKALRLRIKACSMKATTAIFSPSSSTPCHVT
jgi:hypothetical protein